MYFHLRKCVEAVTKASMYKHNAKTEAKAYGHHKHGTKARLQTPSNDTLRMKVLFFVPVLASKSLALLCLSGASLFGDRLQADTCVLPVEHHTTT